LNRHGYRPAGFYFLNQQQGSEKWIEQAKAGLTDLRSHCAVHIVGIV
jgi:hypothetical protein